MTPLPLGFACHVANIGVKDDTEDFVVVAAARPVPAAGVFTKSRFAGPSVIVSREHVADGSAQAIVIVSKNANVANGPDGMSDARELAAGVAGRLGCRPDEVLVASTGVIGRRYPIDRIRAGVAALPPRPAGTAADEAAQGIMTTDTHPKIAEATIADGPARIVGFAKGVGMIEPDMATMIAVVLTDADVAANDLDIAFRRAVDATFNCVSVDTDTSTSDTAVIMASGQAGAVELADFDVALRSV